MPFIGRGDEIVAIAHRLAEPACTLLTLVGQGGIGKTRLAIEVTKYIAQLPGTLDAVYFADLQPVKSTATLVGAIIDSLGVLLAGPEDARTQLLRYLDKRKVLLLLDNFEQILEAIDLLTAIVRVAPDSKIL